MGCFAALLLVRRQEAEHVKLGWVGWGCGYTLKRELRVHGLGLQGLRGFARCALGVEFSKRGSSRSPVYGESLS